MVVKFDDVVVSVTFVLLFGLEAVVESPTPSVGSRLTLVSLAIAVASVSAADVVSAVPPDTQSTDCSINQYISQYKHRHS